MTYRVSSEIVRIRHNHASRAFNLLCKPPVNLYQIAAFADAILSAVDPTQRLDARLCGTTPVAPDVSLADSPNVHRCVSRWIKAAMHRRHVSGSAIALANKTARIAWVILASNDSFKRGSSL